MTPDPLPMGRVPAPRLAALACLCAALLLVPSCGGDSPASPDPEPEPPPPPLASITSPGEGALHGVGQEVRFEGTGRDGEGRALGGNSLVWTSDLDGELGRGASVTRSDLSVGEHAVRLSVTDARGQSAADSIVVRVLGAPSVAIAAPEDAFFEWAGTELVFEGSAEDAQGVVLGGDALLWASDRDGELGTGTSVSTTALSEGEHEISLRATDARGVEATARIDLTVGVATIETPLGGTLYPVGSSVAFEARDLGLAEGAFVWESDRDGVIGTGRALEADGLSFGEHRVSLTATAPSGATARTEVEIRVTSGFTLEGQLVPLPGRAVPALEARAISGSFEGVAGVAGDGSFEVTIPEPGLLDSLVVLVDSPDPEARTHFPVYINFGGTVPESASWLPPDAAPDTVFHQVRAALVPMTWTIADGPFAGQEVPIRLDAAATWANDGLSYYFAQDIGSLIDAGWAEELLPLPLGFHHDSTHVPITAADSVAFWSAVERLEERFGERLFEPSIHPEGEGMRSMGRVTVAIDTTMFAAASAGPWWWRPFHQDVQAHGQVRLLSSPVRFQQIDGLHNEWLVMHELAHALGLGHTCEWGSILGGGGSGCPGEEPSAEDVAHEQLKRAVLNLRLEADVVRPRIVFGLEYSRLGERVVLLGLPPYRSGAEAEAMRTGPHPGFPRVEEVERTEDGGWLGRLRFH